MTNKLGLQIVNFSYGTGVPELFPSVIAQAQEAEAAGFDSVFVTDHFYQLPRLGSPHEPVLGYEFGTFTDRFNKLDEALQIILPILKGERPTSRLIRASATTSR